VSPYADGGRGRRGRSGHAVPMPTPRKLKKRPCSVCHHWFQPNPRTVKCQKTCGPACSKAWKDRQQADWRRKNPAYQVNRRLDAKVKQAMQPGAVVEIAPATAPLARLPWDHAKTAFGPERAVLLAFALRLQHRERKTAFRVKIRTQKAFPGRLPPSAAKTAIAPGP